MNVGHVVKTSQWWNTFFLWPSFYKTEIPIFWGWHCIRYNPHQRTGLEEVIYNTKANFAHASFTSIKFFIKHSFIVCNFFSIWLKFYLVYFSKFSISTKCCTVLFSPHILFQPQNLNFSPQIILRFFIVYFNFI